MSDAVPKPLHERVSQALDGAGDLTGTALIEHIERRHGDDLELVAEVRSLLGASQDASVPLLDDSGPAQELARKLQDKLLTSELFTHGGTPTTRAENSSPVPMPQRVGAYEVVRVLGQGGMGVVYEAMQASPRRRVALKMLSSSVPTRSALLRFKREAEVLGRLKHPGIAQVFEAASDAASGAAFFAMEYVDGPPLTTFAETHRLTISQRVELVARVCDAIQHAHQGGVIHRDLKPTNILAENSGDGIGQPKVLDFGVASLTRETEQQTTLALDAGRIIGTLGYMPPEAIDGSAGAAGPDTRGDIYSLGVILYELLTGVLPVDVRGASLTEAARRIREVAPAPLATLASPVDKAMRGDLELIVRKSLQKDASQRYSSAGEFAADLRRCLRHEPVLARPSSTWYTLRKFVRRRRGVSALVIASTLLVVSAAVVASVQYAKADRALAREAEQRAIAERKREDAERGQYQAAIAAAVAAERSGSAMEARRALQQAPAELRGWEWRYLNRKVSPGRVVNLGEPVRFLTPFDAGRQMLCETRTSPVRTLMWDVASGKVTRTFELSNANATEDGSLIVGVTASGELTCLRPDGSVAWRKPAQASSRWINADFVRLSPDEPIRAALISTFAVVMVEAESGNEIWRAASDYANERGGVVEMRDQDHPFVVGMWQQRPNRERVFVDVRTGEWIESGVSLRRYTPAINFAGLQWNLFWRLGEEAPGRPSMPDALWRAGINSRESELIAVGDSRGLVHTYVRDPRNERVFLDGSVMPTGDGEVQELCFVNHERELAVLDHTGTVRIMPTMMPREPLQNVMGEKQTTAGAVSPDGTRVLTYGWASVAVYDTLTGLPVWRANLGRTFPLAVSWNNDGTQIVWCGDRDNELSEFFVLDAQTGKQLVGYSTSPVNIDPISGRSPAPWQSHVRKVAFHPTKPIMLMAHGDGVVRALDTRTWQLMDAPQMNFGADDIRFQSIAYSPDGEQVAITMTRREGGQDMPMPVVIASGESLATRVELPMDEGTWTAEWRTDNRRLLVGHSLGKVSEWDVATKTRLWQSDLNTTSNVLSIAFSESSQRIAAGTYGSAVYLIDENGSPTATIASPVSEVVVRGFDEDDTLLVSGVGTTLLRYVVADRDKDNWTPPAIAAWPDSVARPERMSDARLLLQHAGDLLSTLAPSMMSLEQRLARVRNDEVASADVKLLAEHWLRTLRFSINWNNSDALVLMRDRSSDPTALRTAVRLLEEAVDAKPTAPHLRLNLSRAYAMTDQLDASLASLRRAEALYRDPSSTFGIDERLGIATSYLESDTATEATRMLDELDSWLRTNGLSPSPAQKTQLEELRLRVNAATCAKSPDPRSPPSR